MMRKFLFISLIFISLILLIVVLGTKSVPTVNASCEPSECPCDGGSCQLSCCVYPNPTDPPAGGGGCGPDPGNCGIGRCWDDTSCSCTSEGCGGAPAPTSPPCSSSGSCSDSCTASCGGGTCHDNCGNTIACNTQSCCTNAAPSTPTLSSPADGSVVGSISPAPLSWNAVSSWGTNCAGNNNNYTVYFDTHSSPTTVLCTVASGTTSCNTGSLSDATVYYWKVKADNAVLSTTSSTWSFTSPYTIFGWLYTEINNTINRTTAVSEGLIPNYTINLTGGATFSTTSQASAISGYLANYYFQNLVDNVYTVSLAVTPTGSVLYPGYTNPQQVVIAGGVPDPVDFPFVTVTPVSVPTLTPTITPTLTPPPVAPSPTSVFTPTPTITPGGPSLTPTVTPTLTITPGGPSLTPTPTISPGGPSLTPTTTPVQAPGCSIALPTPVLQTPAHNICTNVKPAFAATVQNLNNDNVWAHFYTNYYETFSRIGSTILTGPGDSTWTPDGSVLNTTGNYWWTAFTESPTCTKSADAPARLLTMDYASPPQPGSPNCTLQSQSLVSGQCTFSCSWTADPEPTPASCSDTADYNPVFRTTPSGGWDPGWVGNILSTNVVTNDGQVLYAKLAARDGLSNTSSFSDESAGFTCPKINYSATPTPGGPTYTPTPTATPTITPSPTITPTPTPGDWIQIQGSDTYQKSYNYPVPAGEYFIKNLTGDSYNSGIAWSGQGSWNFGFGSISDTNKKVSTSLTNSYNFTYFTESLKNKDKVTVTDTATVGTAAKLDETNTIYSYSGLGYYVLDTSFVPKTAVTIFLISGSLEISQDFSVPAGDTVVFIVNGNINVKGTVREIPGFYVSSQTFSIASGPGQFTLNGMVYANSLSFNRTYHSFTSPAYEIIYQPQYAVTLLPYLGRNEVNWQEVGP